MKRVAIVLVLALVITIVWAQTGEGPEPGSVAKVEVVRGQIEVTKLPQTEFRFVGVTTETFRSDAGFYAMTQACYEQYRGARMAYGLEYRQTVNPPAVPVDAWIQPQPAFMANCQTPNPTLIDATGAKYSRNGMDCDSWTVVGSGYFGLTVTTTGALKANDCSGERRPVACAAPM